MNLAKASNAALVQRFHRLSNLTCTALREGCKILVELEKRGENVGPLSRGLFRYYRQIANGSLAPAAVLAFAGNTFVLPRLMALPVAEQRKYADGAPVPVVEHNQEGKLVTVEKPLRHLVMREAELVFTDSGIRPVDAQKRLVAKRVKQTHRSAVPLAIRADMATEEIVIGQLRVKVAELYTPLKKLGFDLVRARKAAA